MIGDLLGGFDGYAGDAATFVDRQLGVARYDEDVNICSNIQLLILMEWG